MPKLRLPTIPSGNANAGFLSLTRLHDFDRHTITEFVIDADAPATVSLRSKRRRSSDQLARGW